MKAIVRDAYGSPDVLELRDIDRPEIGDDEVLVRARAAGLDRGVWHLMTGLPYLARVIGHGLRPPRNPVLGSDAAGVVEAVGRDVSTFQPGDEVFGIGEGSFAEYVRAREKSSRPVRQTSRSGRQRPVAISSLTALQGLRDRVGAAVVNG